MATCDECKASIGHQAECSVIVEATMREVIGIKLREAMKEAETSARDLEAAVDHLNSARARMQNTIAFAREALAELSRRADRR